MSIAEFSNAIREAAYVNWFKKSGKNVLVQTTSDLRVEAEQQNRTSFFLSTDTLLQIAEKLAGRTLSEDETHTLFGDLFELIDNKKAVLIQEELQKGNKTITGVYFRQINFDRGISSVLDSSLKSIQDRVVIEDKDGKTRPARVSDFFQRGHVFGIAANVSTQTAYNLEKSSVSRESKDKLLRVLISVRNRLIKDDIRSSNIKDLKFSLYAKYFKTPYRYLVEMQLNEVNRASGNETAVFTNALRRYFKPENSVALNKFINDPKKDSSGDNLFRKLMSVKGSPSYIDLAIQEVISKLTKKKKQTTFASDSVKILDTKTTFDTRKLKADNIKKLKAINEAINKTKSIVVPKVVSSNISGLEALLRVKLHDQIKRNMGTGNAKNVLNYRTGRFAKSATIERVSLSREGMVSVFYDYMRYPYATFSAGGIQESPKTRDPKLLISKSIREIGATIAGNRMRAVLV